MSGCCWRLSCRRFVARLIRRRLPKFWLIVASLVGAVTIIRNSTKGCIPLLVLTLLMCSSAFAESTPDVSRLASHTPVDVAIHSKPFQSHSQRSVTKVIIKQIARLRSIQHAGPRFPRRPLPSVGGADGTIDHALIDDETFWSDSSEAAAWRQTGMASWYGGTRWQGKSTSSGTLFDEQALTAAHATLPMGTKVKVVRHDGLRSVIVTITARPGTRARIIDLSRAAAKELGIIDSGVTMVTLQAM